MKKNPFPKPNTNIDKLNREFDIGNDRLDYYFGAITRFFPERYRSHEIMAILIGRTN